MKRSQSVKRQVKARKRRLRIARQKIEDQKKRIQKRIKHVTQARKVPAFTARNIQYEISDRTAAICYGGLGVMHSLARQCGLIDAIDRRVELLKFHSPYHESDHVLNIAYNALTDGKCLEDLELKRCDEAYLNALGATRIPDPTTAGDFCRRFETRQHIDALQKSIAEARGNVWWRQPDDFFDEAVVDMDGSIVPTSGECKEGMDISYRVASPTSPVVSIEVTVRPPFEPGSSLARTWITMVVRSSVDTESGLATGGWLITEVTAVTVSRTVLPTTDRWNAIRRSRHGSPDAQSDQTKSGRQLSAVRNCFANDCRSVAVMENAVLRPHQTDTVATGVSRAAFDRHCFQI
ncbi:MAG: hypothetical protein R3C59_07315 [Planctomycetaceae bacterium]